ncbi:MAG: pyruvoyl-dependent arginine decarboxylase [Planctomycetota bacterium]|jgi:arginine decarboxylase
MIDRLLRLRKSTGIVQNWPCVRQSRVSGEFGVACLCLRVYAPRLRWPLGVSRRVLHEEMIMDAPLVPQRVFFTKGVGKHHNRLQSFELALRKAGIEQCNLVRVSSILPPGCKVIARSRGLERLKPGQITFVVLAEASTNEPSRMVGAGIGVAQPTAGDQYGYISEHHGFGLREKRLADLVEDMAATMLATTLGIEFDPETAYDDRKEIYRMSGKIVRTTDCVQTAEGDKNGLWTTVVAAAVFLL